MQRDGNIERKRKLMLEGGLYKTLLLISLPAALTNLITEVFNLFDIYFSGQIGKTQMAASVFVGPIVNVVSAVGAGFGVAAVTLVAKELAKRNYDAGRKILSQMLLIAAVISAGLLLICLACANPILSLAGASGDLLEVSKEYFQLVILTLPLSFFNNIYFGEQRAIGNNKQIMVLSVASIVIKFIASYVMIIQCKMGIAGLGYSSMIATAFTSLFAIYDLFFKKTEMRLKFKDFGFSWKVIVIVFLVSIPIIVEKSTQSFGNVIINGYATGLGEKVLSAYGITNRINSIIFSFSSGFGIALVGIISQNRSIGNIERIKEAKKKGLILSLAIVSGLLVIVFSLSGVISNIYAGSDTELYSLILTAMSIYTISAIPWTVMHIYFGIFQGYQKTHYTLIVSLCRLWLFRVLLVGVLIRFTQMGAYAIWYGMLISNILAMMMSILIYILKFKKNIKKELTTFSLGDKM